jgi:hypothetical protein
MYVPEKDKTVKKDLTICEKSSEKYFISYLIVIRP